MMHARVCFAFALVALLANFGRVDAQFINDTVSELDVRFYAGEWFEVIASESTFTFRTTRYCTRAVYTLNDDGTFQVFNEGRNDNVSGSIDAVGGIGYIPDPVNFPGRFLVNIDSSPFNATYWVFELGPLESAGYQYAIVSNSDRSSLFVLARNVDEYFSRFGEQVNESLVKFGFTGPTNSPSGFPVQVGCPGVFIGDTVEELDTDAYLGRWLTVYQSLAVLEFQFFTACVEATYGLNDDGTIAVWNQGRTSANGTIGRLFGTASPSDPNEAGRFLVDLGVGAIGSYWIYELGPIEEGEYQYAIVADQRRESLFVLARDVTDFFSRFDTGVRERLVQLEFTGERNSPIPVIQQGCLPNPGEWSGETDLPDESFDKTVKIDLKEDSPGCGVAFRARDGASVEIQGAGLYPANAGCEYVLSLRDSSGAEIADVNSGVINRGANQFSSGAIVPTLALENDATYYLTASSVGDCKDALHFDKRSQRHRSWKYGKYTKEESDNDDGNVEVLGSVCCRQSRRSGASVQCSRIRRSSGGFEDFLLLRSAEL